MLWLVRQQLKSGSPAMRRRALEGLCLNPDPRAVPALRAALDDDDPEVRRLAVEAIGRLEEDRPIEPLLQALRDAETHVVYTALGVLRSVKDVRVALAVAPLLHHLDGAVRGRAAQLLRSQEWHPTNRDEEIWFLIAQGLFTRAAGYGVAAVPALESVVESSASSLRVGAVEALGAIGDVSALRPLVSALKSDDAAVTVAAVDGLLKMGGPDVIDPLCSALRHVNSHVRVAAAEALGRLAAPAAAPTLRLLLGDSRWDVRRAAAEALGRLKDKQSLEQLTLTLRDEDADVREAAAIALGGLGDRFAIGPLILALKDPTSGVRRIASAALSRIDEDWSNSVEARAAFDELKTALNDRDPEVRNYVGQLLVSLGELGGRLGPGGATEPSESWPTKRRKLAVSLFLAVLCDADRDLRLAAAQALGRLADRRAQPALAHALADPEPAVRDAAQAALQFLENAVDQ